jgi:hypothetical protein
VALASTAIAIALGATSMSDIEVLGQLAPVLGAAPSDSTVRRTLNLADDRTMTRIAQARARIRRHVWKQVEDAGGFPWLSAGGKKQAGWTIRSSIWTASWSPRTQLKFAHPLAQ